MTNQEAKKIFDNLLEDWCRELRLHFEESLIGILQFGSTTKDYLKFETDIDLMFLFTQIPKNRRDRFKLLNEFEVSLSRDLYSKLPNYNIVISPLFRVPSDLNTFSVLYLDMVEHSVIRFDSEGLLKTTIERTKSWIQKSGSYKVHQGTKWYWVLNPNGTNGNIDW